MLSPVALQRLAALLLVGRLGLSIEQTASLPGRLQQATALGLVLGACVPEQRALQKLLVASMARVVALKGARFRAL